MNEPISEIELHALIDGELSPERAAVVEAAVARDPELAARVSAFRADKLALLTAYTRFAHAPVPAALLAAARNGASASAPGRRRGRYLALAGATALAASVVLTLTLTHHEPRDSAVEQALAARQHSSSASRALDGRDPDTVIAINRVMSEMLGMPARVPNLAQAGFMLVSADIYGTTHPDSVQLRYEDAGQRLFTVFLRPSAGPDSFMMTEVGPVRLCVWQNEDVTAIMTGAMSTPELLRLASLTYSSLGL